MFCFCRLNINPTINNEDSKCGLLHAAVQKKSDDIFKLLLDYQYENAKPSRSSPWVYTLDYSKKQKNENDQDEADKNTDPVNALKSRLLVEELGFLLAPTMDHQVVAR